MGGVETSQGFFSRMTKAKMCQPIPTEIQTYKETVTTQMQAATQSLPLLSS